MFYCQQNTILRPDVSDLLSKNKAPSISRPGILFINGYLMGKMDFILLVKLGLAISPEIKMGG